MPVIRTYQFTRCSDSDAHPVLGVSLVNSVRYDLLEGECIVAALATNNAKTVAQFLGRKRLFMNSSGFIWATVKRHITDENGKLYAEILIKRPFWGPDQYSIRFNGEEGVYTFRYCDTKPGVENGFLDFKAELLKGDQAVCTIQDYGVRNRFYDPRTYALKGVIEMYDNVEREKALVLVQVLQLYFELKMLL